MAAAYAAAPSKVVAMRSLMTLGLGCSGCVTLLGILLSLTLVGIHIGFPLVVIGVLGLIGFGVGRAVFREPPRSP